MLVRLLLLRRVVKRIKRATDYEIHVMLLAIIDWQKHHYPDEELIILSLPKSNPEKREMYLKMVVHMLRQYCEKNDY